MAHQGYRLLRADVETVEPEQSPGGASNWVINKISDPSNILDRTDSYFEGQLVSAGAYCPRYYFKEFRFRLKEFASAAYDSDENTIVTGFEAKVNIFRVSGDAGDAVLNVSLRAPSSISDYGLDRDYSIGNISLDEISTSNYEIKTLGGPTTIPFGMISIFGGGSNDTKPDIINDEVFGLTIRADNSSENCIFRIRYIEIRVYFSNNEHSYYQVANAGAGGTLR